MHETVLVLLVALSTSFGCARASPDEGEPILPIWRLEGTIVCVGDSLTAAEPAVVWHGHPAVCPRAILAPARRDSHGQDGRATHGRDAHATVSGHNATGSAATALTGRDDKVYS